MVPIDTEEYKTYSRSRQPSAVNVNRVVQLQPMSDSEENYELARNQETARNASMKRKTI